MWRKRKLFFKICITPKVLNIFTQRFPFTENFPPNEKMTVRIWPCDINLLIWIYDAYNV